MNAKEKAKELAWKFAYKADHFHDGDLPGKKGKECALICVDELILSTTPDDYPRPKNRMDREY